jgi:hypothetical protein
MWTKVAKKLWKTQLSCFFYQEGNVKIPETLRIEKLKYFDLARIDIVVELLYLRCYVAAVVVAVVVGSFHTSSYERGLIFL